MIDRRKVYYFRWTGEPKYTGLAMDCQIRVGEGWKGICFFDSIRGHMIDGDLVRETEDGFVFRASLCEPGEWTFKELTIEEFRRWVYKHVELGEVIADKIRTTADLHEWYRKKFGFPFD